MIFGANLVFHLREIDPDLPSDGLPIHAGATELYRFRAFVTVRCRYSYAKDSRVEERENRISRRNLTHGFVKRVQPVTLGTLWGPEVSFAYFVLMRLILVHPPITHAACSPSHCSAGFGT